MIPNGTVASDVGRRRDRNEDSFLLNDELGLYAVADGMGGHAAGEVASQTALNAFSAAVDRGASTLETGDADAVSGLLKAAMAAACAEVWRLAEERPDLRGMGCTLTSVVMCGTKAVLAHVGDSRMYLIRQGEAHQLSLDHSMAAELARAGVIKPEQVATHAYAHVLSRAIGTQEAVQADVLAFSVAPGDLLVLCSDGLSDYVPDPQWLAEQAALAADEGPDSLPERLVRFANEQGGKDNITAVVVAIDADPDKPEVARRAATLTLLTPEAFRSVFLLEGLGLRQLARVLECCTLRELAPGQVVVTEGEALDRLVVVVDGTLELETEAGVRTLAAGGHLGATAVLSPRPARTTARAADEVRLVELTAASFSGLLQARPRLGVQLLGRLARRLAVAADSEEAA